VTWLRSDGAGRSPEGDQEVDRRYGRLQSELVTVIARQAQVASDLRLITALLHISRMVERIGDQCVNVAKLATVGGPPPAGAEEFQRCLLAMGSAAQAAVHEATRALQDHDAGAARQLADSDSEINELNRSCFSRAIALGDSEERRAWSTAMILVARAFERIADNAVDITAHLGFAITGTFEPRPAAA
jgi:phosphate transport system protein